MSLQSPRWCVVEAQEDRSTEEALVELDRERPTSSVGTGYLEQVCSILLPASPADVVRGRGTLP